ncbi:MAG: hypothetical protein ACM31L_04580 [Actinomycetota bacterium]
MGNQHYTGGTKIKVADLDDGDIMLKFSDDSVLNTFIHAGQGVFTDSKASAITHAGIYAQGYIIEVNGEGLNCDPLDDKDHKDLHYLVMRAVDPNVAHNIGGLAWQTYNRSGKALEEGKKLTYSKSGAFASLFRKGNASEKELIDSIEKEMGLLYLRQGASQFCSEFVSICIQYALKNCEVKLDGSLGKLAKTAQSLTPANLTQALLDSKKHFKFWGVLPGGSERQ